MKKIIYFLTILAAALFFNACGTVAPYPNPAPGGALAPVSNPFIQLADVHLVGCYGDRATATVTFAFIVTSRTNAISSGRFGAFPNSKFVARGHAYKSYNSDGVLVELVPYAPSDVVITNIREVPDYIAQFDRVELQWYFTPSHHSGKNNQHLFFHNVPIIWQ